METKITTTQHEGYTRHSSARLEALLSVLIPERELVENGEYVVLSQRHAATLHIEEGDGGETLIITMGGKEFALFEEGAGFILHEFPARDTLPLCSEEHGIQNACAKCAL